MSSDPFRHETQVDPVGDGWEWNCQCGAWGMTDDEPAAYDAAELHERLAE